VRDREMDTTQVVKRVCRNRKDAEICKNPVKVGEPDDKAKQVKQSHHHQWAVYETACTGREHRRGCCHFDNL